MADEEIVTEILDYLQEASPAAVDRSKIPLDESLYEIGILDSFGVVEMVDFIEKKWAIRILDTEITLERFGSIHKMARLIRGKIDAK